MEIIKSNADFIKKYGQFEFYEMCKFVPQDLAIARISKNIGGYKINKTKKRVIFYRKNKKSVCLDFATIFTLGYDQINKYINEGEEFLNEKS